MIFAKYNSYKDSGVEWLGEIPSHWGVKRVKDFCKVNKETLSENRIFNKEIAYVDIGSVDANYGITTVENMYFSEAPSRARRIVRNGDIIISTVRTYLKAIAYIDKNFTGSIVSTGFATLTPNNGLLSKYLYYSVFSNYFIERIIAYSVGVSYPAIDSSFLRCNFVLIAKKEEQIKISNFLDKKTSQIDRKIKLLQEKKGSYEELKKTLINETVCRGLNKDAELKDSGIEWIGKIPKRWKIERGKDKFYYEKKINKGLICKNVLSLTYDGVINKDSNTNAGLNPGSYETYQFVNKEDLIFKLIDLENIRTSRVGIVHEHGIMSSAYIRLKLKKCIFSRYYYYLYFFYYKINLFNFLGGGVRSTLNYSSLLEIPIISPPFIEEQIQIAKYLDEKTSKIDKIVSKKNDQIESLKEFRKTLINDVVTGKVRIQDE